MTLNKTLAGIIFGGLLLSLFIPFLVANSMFFPFITGKGFAFRIGIEILFVLWIVLALRDRSYLPKFSWILGTILIFLAVIGVADFFGVYPYKSFWSNFERMEGYITLLHLFMYFVVTSVVLNTHKRWNIFLGTSIGASLIMCFYGFLQLAGKITINQGGVRLDGTLGNAIYLAAYMLFNIFFAVYLATRVSWSRGVRYLVFVPVVLMQGIILYYTASRGVILGLIGGAFLAALLIALFEKQNAALRRHAIIGLVAVVVLVGGFFAIRNTDFVKKSPTLGRFATLSASDIKTQGRYFIWPMAIKGFQDRPLLGWGQEGFNYVFNQYYDAHMYSLEAWFDRTHNIFLDWLIAGGILGLGSYLAILAMLVYSIWRSSFGVRERALLTGLVAAYVFQNMFAFDNITSYLFFFSLLAFIHGDSTKDKAPIRWLDTRVQSIFHSGDVHNRNTYQGVAVSVAVIMLITVLYVFNIKPLFANFELLSALDLSRGTPAQSIEHFKNAIAYDSFGSPEAREQLYAFLPQFQQAGVPADARNAFESLGKEELARQVERTPHDARYLLFLGSFLNRTRQYSEAIPYLERAVVASPQKQAILFELGVAQVNSGKTGEALAVFKKAFDYDPSVEDARIFYGIGALYNHNETLANQVFAPLDPQRLVLDDRIVNAYVSIGAWGRVIDLLKQRIALDPKSIQPYFSLAAAYLKAGDRFSSIQQLQRAKQVDPKVAEQADFFIKEIQAGRNPG